MLNVGTQIPVYKTRCLIFRLKYLTVNSTRDIYLILHAQHGQWSSSLTLYNGTVDSPSIQAREEMDRQPLASKNAGDSIVPWCKVRYKPLSA
jgi:hypothetical protein